MISVFWEGVEPDGKSSGEEVEGIGGSETIIRIYSIKLFLTRWKMIFILQESKKFRVYWFHGSTATLGTTPYSEDLYFNDMHFEYSLTCSSGCRYFNNCGTSYCFPSQNLPPISMFVMAHGYLIRIVFSIRHCHEHLAVCIIKGV